MRATHHFLGEAAQMAPVHCIRDAEGRVCAFMYVANGAIEALFIAPEQRGKGLGRALVAFALQSLGATRVDVNEQNGDALRFYQRMGFEIAGRSAVDEYGNPFPILHLSKSQRPS